MTAVDPCAWPDIHNIVGGLHCFLIVLHHNDGVAQVTQVFQRLYQPRIIPLVQSDGRLIKNIQNPHETGADLGCEPDTLAFATGKGAGAASEGQIIQSHISKERKPALDLLDDLTGDLLLHIGQRQGIHKLQRVPYAHFAEVADIDAAHRHRQHFRAQTVSVTVGAGNRGHKRGNIIPHPLAVGLLKAAFQIVDNALKFIDKFSLEAGGLPHHLKLFALCSVKHQIQLILWHIFYRNIQRDAEVLA